MWDSWKPLQHILSSNFLPLYSTSNYTQTIIQPNPKVKTAHNTQNNNLHLRTIIRYMLVNHKSYCLKVMQAGSRWEIALVLTWKKPWQSAINILIFYPNANNAIIIWNGLVAVGGRLRKFDQKPSIVNMFTFNHSEFHL